MNEYDEKAREIAEKWRLPARRDDLFNLMVPSDVRQLIGAIDRLVAFRTEAIEEAVAAEREAVSFYALEKCQRQDKDRGWDYRQGWVRAWEDLSDWLVNRSRKP